ncbi:hypothetical protein LX15_002959 [Streptoalloteichus tenebrarius]|uniref:DUF1883 domain-containing protein n=2 Tax=Streptoalloteichus tenebrarius (strain ATCC 17920 / DSM 40477 / JCM 4838 / CBS 697.72 / NBRC 16177 / NCIMB 11028 / NRRL B-12390 / A12253. 1 / ISP 5477) TaxID=1933 RepID=A0ABT1HUQ8_STRSD|nr:hypothetical protein [Streptoalloteichus tenebrarius]MCP2259258.1 hypothetical protein [Streptoalloteichus tenebrarius]BFE99017.1 hypothetical protein GCM10020241_06930 [Streptoalloteichus tenebrarius]
MAVKWRPPQPLNSTRHLVRLFRIERGQRVLRFEDIDEDDYWQIAPGGPAHYAVGYAHAYFLKHHIPAGQRWIIVVDVLPTRQGDSPQRLCEVHLAVPPEDDIAEKRIGPPQPILSYLLRTP